MGILVAPGVRGLASDRVVEDANQVAWTFAYLVAGLLVMLVVYGAIELSRSSRAKSPLAAAAVSAAGLVAALTTPALQRPLFPALAAALALVTVTVVVLGGVRGLRVKHTRAVAALMLAFAAAGLVRVVAWELARRAGDAGDTRLYEVARVMATAALLFEGLGQMVAAAWLGTRSRFGGQVLSSLAVALAWLLTYAASVGAGVNAKPWQAAAHIALATATGLPQPYGPTGLAVFLLAASILLAGVAAIQQRQVVAVTTPLALSLIGRGAFDVPIHALAATAASLWLILASTDERAVWQALIAARGARGGNRVKDRPPSEPVGASRTPGGPLARAQEKP
jgi:hypothetical protein